MAFVCSERRGMSYCTAIRWAIASLFTLAMSGCSMAVQPSTGAIQPPPPPSPTGGPCDYVSRPARYEVVGAVVSNMPQGTAYFRLDEVQGSPADKQLLLSGWFRDTPLSVGQSFGGAIQEATKGSCPPAMYSVTVNGISYDLLPVDGRHEGEPGGQ